MAFRALPKGDACLTGLMKETYVVSPTPEPAPLAVTPDGVSVRDEGIMRPVCEAGIEKWLSV